MVQRLEVAVDAVGGRRTDVDGTGRQLVDG